jgi:hypothetical protein
MLLSLRETRDHSAFIAINSLPGGGLLPSPVCAFAYGHFVFGYRFIFLGFLFLAGSFVYVSSGFAFRA